MTIPRKPRLSIRELRDRVAFAASDEGRYAHNVCTISKRTADDLLVVLDQLDQLNQLNQFKPQARVEA